MDARYSRQILVPNIGTDGQARIQEASFFSTSTKDTLRRKSLVLYAERAGLKESRQTPKAESEEPEEPESPFILKLAEFFQVSACRSIGLGAADALVSLNNALEQPSSSSEKGAPESES